MESPHEEQASDTEHVTDEKPDGGCPGALLLPGILLLGLGCYWAVGLVRSVFDRPAYECNMARFACALAVLATSAVVGLGSLCLGLSGRALGYRFGRVFLWIAAAIGGLFAVVILWVLMAAVARG